jgi:hypothetical protein
MSGTAMMLSDAWATSSRPLVVVTVSISAPRDRTSTILLTVFSTSVRYDAMAMTSVPSSMSEMVPCLSFAAAYARSVM